MIRLETFVSDPVERGPGARARRRAVIGAWGRLAVHYGTPLPPENQEH